MNKSLNKKNMKRDNNLFRIFYGNNKKLSTMLLASIATLSVVSCADNDLLMETKMRIKMCVSRLM